MITSQKNIKSEAEIQVPIESIWEHFKGGQYQILSHELDATSYEDNRPPSVFVRYVQLSDGRYPKGTIWIRQFSDFVSMVEGVERGLGDLD